MTLIFLHCWVKKKAILGHYLFNINSILYPLCNAPSDKPHFFISWETQVSVAARHKTCHGGNTMAANPVHHHFLLCLRFVLLSKMQNPPAIPPLFRAWLTWNTSFPLQVKTIKMRLCLLLALCLHTKLCIHTAFVMVELPRIYYSK